MIIFKNNISQKSISSILIIAVILLIVSPILLLPKETKAAYPVSVLASLPTTVQTFIEKAYYAISKAYDKGTLTQEIISAGELVWQNSEKIRTWASAVLLNLLFHQILAQLTNDLTNWIENGTEPRFMTEGLGAYLGDAVDNATGNFIDQYLGAGWLCEEFDIDIKLALLDVPTFETESQCSLSDIVDNIDDFYHDFSRGGWEGWLEITKPQNNFYGALLLAQGKMNKVATEAEEENKADAQSGDGFLGTKDCTWYDASGKVIVTQQDVRGTPKLPDACKPNAEGNTPGVVRPCNPRCETKNPGSVISALADKSVTNFYDKMNAQIGAATAKAGPYQVYVQAVVDSLINRVMNEAGGFLEGIDLSEPGYGEIGASEGLPEIEDPESTMEDENNATAIDSQLDLNRDDMEELLEEQETNLALLESIKEGYEGLLSNLNEVVTACTTASNSEYVDWANTEIDDINNNLIPFYEEEINQMETIDIVNTTETIDGIDATTILIQEYLDKVENYESTYEEVAGMSDNTDLVAAKEEMDEAKEAAILSMQEILTLINGTTLSSDFEDLYNEFIYATIAIVERSIDLEEERGISSFPDEGTLYAELEEIEEIKAEADGKAEICNTSITL